MANLVQYDTPSNIMDLSFKEVLDMTIEGDMELLKYNKETRLKMIQLLYNIYGYTLTQDAAMILLDEANTIAILATAGAGKTSIVMMKVILEKLNRLFRTFNGKIKPINGTDMLVIVYNKHNVYQIEQRHKTMVNKLRATGMKGINIDSNLSVNTMHSFSLKWLNEYKEELNLTTNGLLEDSKIKTIYRNIARRIASEYGIDYLYIKYDDVLQLNALLRETLTSYDNMDKLPLFHQINLNKSFLVKLYEELDVIKNSSKILLYDYTDMLALMHKKLKEDKDFRTRVQRNYNYIIVDEFQDFTPIMIEIMTLIKKESTPLICVGDEDQSIYNFKGADIFASLDFRDRFENGRIMSLLTNRRCSEYVLDVARSVIKHNELRFDKNIVGVNPGGIVKFVPYNTIHGEYHTIMKKLLSMSDDEYSSTLICYRNKKSSLILSEMLEESGLPFHLLSGYLPFSHELYRHILGILEMLYNPYDLQKIVNLFKLMPCNKKDLYNAIEGFDAKNMEWKEEPDCSIFELNYGGFSSSPIFVETLTSLNIISDSMDKVSMDKYFGMIYDLFCNNYWIRLKKSSSDGAIDDYYTKAIKDFFSSDKKYKVFLNSFIKRKRSVSEDNKSKSGVCLSTFHGLKGLEYDNVIMIDMDDSIFPDFPSKELLDSISEKDKKDIKECETRLCYVAITRAKKNLEVYYNNDNPSVYIDWMKDGVKEDNYSDMSTQDSLDIIEVFDKINDDNNEFDGDIDIDISVEDLGVEGIDDEFCAVDTSETTVNNKQDICNDSEDDLLLGTLDLF